jgi:hypothetical protein
MALTIWWCWGGGEGSGDVGVVERGF